MFFFYMSDDMQKNNKKLETEMKSIKIYKCASKLLSDEALVFFIWESGDIYRQSSVKKPTSKNISSNHVSIPMSIVL